MAEKLGDNRPKLGSKRDAGKSVRKWRSERGLDEVDAWDNKDGVMAISASKLIEVSLVTEGAIPGAEVEKVAAAETQGTAATESTPEPQIDPGLAAYLPKSPHTLP